LDRNAIRELYEPNSELINKSLTSLQILKLSHNKISSFGSMVNHPFLNLEHLDLSFNRLEAIDEELSAALPQLKSLNITGNRIHKIPLSLFESSLKQIDIEWPYYSKVLIAQEEWRPSDPQDFNTAIEVISLREGVQQLRKKPFRTHLNFFDYHRMLAADKSGIKVRKTHLFKVCLAAIKS